MNTQKHAGPASRAARGELVALIARYEDWRHEADHNDPDMAADLGWPTVVRAELAVARARLVAALQESGAGYADYAGWRYRLDAAGDLYRERLAVRCGPKDGLKGGGA